MYDPINVNIKLVCEVAERAKKREKSSSNKNSKEYNEITLKIFDELTALNTHHDDFLRGPIESLRFCQEKFFETIDHYLNGKKDGNKIHLSFDVKEERKNAVFVKQTKFDIRKDKMHGKNVLKFKTQEEEEEEVFETV